MSRVDTPSVRLWHAGTELAFADESRLVAAQSWLSATERARFDRFRRDVDRHMFLLGRVMARTLVARTLGIAPDWPWREGPRGRPEMANGTEPALSFNLAHSHGRVVCAISRCGEVGVDIECRHRATLDRQLVRRFCAPTEAADVEAAGDEGWHDRFLRYWTLKEAYLKARGLGIAVHLADLCFTMTTDDIRLDLHGSLAHDDPRWQFYLADLDDSHYVAAAVSTDAPVTFSMEPFACEWMPSPSAERS
jgi:4'-phosphopantetheinyl transferase